MIRRALVLLAMVFTQFVDMTTEFVAAANPRKVHLLLLADGLDGKLGTEFRQSASAIDQLFQKALKDKIANGEIELTRHLIGVNSGESLVDSSIVRELQSIPVLGPDDVLFCVYHAHGTQVKTDPVVPTLYKSREHFFGHAFQTSDKKLILRVNLWYALQSRKAGLTVLMSDSCFQLAPGVSRAMVLAAPPPTEAKQLVHLVTNYKGEVNITSSHPGELSYYLIGGYGIFSEAFVRLADSDDTDDWLVFFKKLQTATQKKYATLGESQDDQKPYDFILNVDKR